MFSQPKCSSFLHFVPPFNKTKDPNHKWTFLIILWFHVDRTSFPSFQIIKTMQPTERLIKPSIKQVSNQWTNQAVSQLVNWLNNQLSMCLIDGCLVSQWVTHWARLSQKHSFLTAFLVAGIGPVPITAGSTPAWPHETIRAKGTTPLLAASAYDISTTAAEPSLMPEEFPAVTEPVPSWRKHGLRRERPSIEVPWRGNSSSVTSTVPDKRSEKKKFKLE